MRQWTRTDARRSLFRLALIAVVSVTALVHSNNALARSELSDNDIRKLLIQGSIAGYSGSCPCPYNIDRGGRRCGGRSAYSRPGGRSPLCYPKDVTPNMIKRFRQSRQ